MQKKKKSRYMIRLTKKSFAVTTAALVLLIGLTFFIGFRAGVESTRYHGNILLVNSSHTLEPGYVPEDLVNLYVNRHSFRLANSDIELTRECYEAAQRMFAAAEAENVNGFIITSGYRSYDRQAEIYSTSEPGLAQSPGASEHQTGLSFDVTTETSNGFENTPQYAWLRAHAAEYGFIQRYPPNKSDITGISYEPWHYRYVGVKAAKDITERGITLEEYIGK